MTLHQDNRVEVRLEIRTDWKFPVGLSLTIFIATLAFVSFLTPAPQKVAGRINDPTLRAAAAINTAMPCRHQFCRTSFGLAAGARTHTAD